MMRAGRTAPNSCTWGFLLRPMSWAADSLSRSQSYLEQAFPFGLRAGFSSRRLSSPPGHSWPWWVLGGLLAELFSNVLWFHNPLPAAVLIYAGNALGAAVGAWLVNRICGRPVRLETLREVLAFVVLGAGIAPVVSATVGSATLAWFGIQSKPSRRLGLYGGSETPPGS